MNTEPAPLKTAEPKPEKDIMDEQYEAEIVARAYAGDLVPATLETLVGPEEDLEDLP